MNCTDNQIIANCFDFEGSCVYSCNNATDTGCEQAGIYGYVKPCQTPPLARPRVNEGYYTPDTPGKIALLSAGGFNASRDRGLLNLPQDPNGVSDLNRFLSTKMAINVSTRNVIIGIIIGFLILIGVLISYKLKKGHKNKED